MQYPIAAGYKVYITQGYGLTGFAKSAKGQAAYKSFPGGIHPGIDFGTGGVNAEAISLVTGTVTRAGLNGGWGNHVEIMGEDGWLRQYGHLSAIKVVIGQKVAPFDIIGRVGTSGFSTGVHLHYGKRRKKLMSGYEYADPSKDFEGLRKPTPAPRPPAVTKAKLIKGDKDSSVFIISKEGKTKHHIPNWETLVHAFGSDRVIGIVDQATMDKIPEGAALPDLSK